MEYSSLSENIQKQIIQDNPAMASRMQNTVRRRMNHDESNLWRPSYIRDCEKILHCPYYNRYSDKTQVFSYYKNDDISRRSLHVQLVSRVARNISTLLGLDVDLTEAIALGHDIGHTPFGHAGEACIDELSTETCGKAFLHNLHSVRVLDKIFPYNISLFTLDGILCHNGELPLDKYIPSDLNDFDTFDENVKKCYEDKDYSKTLVPATLEGCVVRISDLIAYIGKDRQDAIRAKVIENEDIFSKGNLGRFNAAIINNLIVNVVENSYGKNYIRLDREYYEDLMLAMKENYEYIYKSKSVTETQQKVIKPMFQKIFYRLLDDVKKSNRDSYIFRHHVNYINKYRGYYHADDYIEITEPEFVVIDYIASMTDDYFSDLYEHLFPNDINFDYKSYFA